MLPFLLATLGTAALNSSNPKDYCYSARIRSTVLQGLPFGGVPTVLALDFMCFLVSDLVLSPTLDTRAQDIPCRYPPPLSQTQPRKRDCCFPTPVPFSKPGCFHLS
jgi:hypothetical protein